MSTRRPGFTHVPRTEWIIVGGGLAGLSTARALAMAGLGPGLVLEQEPLCGTHASGRNAAIFRLADADHVVRALARRSLGTLDAATNGHAVLQRTGGLTLAAGPDVAGLVERAQGMRAEGLPAVLLGENQARRRFPEVRDIRFELALWCADEGVVDVHALLMRYRQQARQGGFEVRTRATVRELVLEAGRVAGVVSDIGAIRAACVIDASGAWAGRLQGTLGAPPALQPFRRHLFVAERERPWSRRAPFVWMLGDELYVRREGRGFLLSACDETPAAPGLPAVAPSVTALLAEKIERVAPTLGDLAIRRAWACLRTFAPDRRPIIGPDAALHGLYHASGLGGFGVTASAAAGELAASVVRGTRTDWIDTALVSPARLGPRARDASVRGVR
jgi:D-arginine dehydrogenase